MGHNGGDVLARGGVRAVFRPAEKVTQDKWDSIFKDYNADEFMRRGSSCSNSEASGDAGVEPREIESSD